MKVAAYQSPLAVCRSADALDLIREQIERCESLGVEILCCPEAVLGGLADYADQPTSIALDVEGGQLNALLRPLANEAVTTILGFNEIANGRLYNAAALFQKGAIVGLYRKLNPAIKKSVYTAGSAMPVFTVGALTFGIIICRDSTFSAPAADMVSRGAMALFVPTNNGLPSQKSSPRIVADTRACDVALATNNGVSVIRADVAGRTSDLISYGSSEIVNRDGTVLVAAGQLESELIVADIETVPPGRILESRRRRFEVRKRCVGLKRDCRVDLPAKLMARPGQRGYAFDEEEREAELTIRRIGSDSDR